MIIRYLERHSEAVSPAQGAPGDVADPELVEGFSRQPAADFDPVNKFRGNAGFPPHTVFIVGRVRVHPDDPFGKL